MTRCMPAYCITYPPRCLCKTSGKSHILGMHIKRTLKLGSWSILGTDVASSTTSKIPAGFSVHTVFPNLFLVAAPFGNLSTFLAPYKINFITILEFLTSI